MWRLLGHSSQVQLCVWWLLKIAFRIKTKFSHKAMCDLALASSLSLSPLSFSWSICFAWLSSKGSKASFFLAVFGFELRASC
jgi:hypothetical protein